MGIKGILFDKDDTLIDLGTYWCKPTKICIDMLLKKYAAENNDDLRRKLELAGGFDDDRLIPGSVVVTGTNLETMYLFKDIFKVSNLLESPVVPIVSPSFAQFVHPISCICVL